MRSEVNGCAAREKGKTRALYPELISHIDFINSRSALSRRLVGTFCMVLQKVAEEGHLELTDTLIDDNNTSIKVNTSILTGVSIYTGHTHFETAIRARESLF